MCRGCSAVGFVRVAGEVACFKVIMNLNRDVYNLFEAVVGWLLMISFNVYII